jgi:hypothetical protein
MSSPLTETCAQESRAAASRRGAELLDKYVGAVIRNIDTVAAYRARNAVWTDDHLPAITHYNIAPIPDCKEQTITIQYNCVKPSEQILATIEERQSHAGLSISKIQREEQRAAGIISVDQLEINKISSQRMMTESRAKLLDALHEEIYFAEVLIAALQVARHRIHDEWPVIGLLGCPAARTLQGEDLRHELMRIVSLNSVERRVTYERLFAKSAHLGSSDGNAYARTALRSY